MDDFAAMRAEIERLQILLYWADAVIFDTCVAGSRRPATETPSQLSTWAEMSVQRYLSVNPQCRPKRRP
jgi:hypothetical protein